MSVDLFDVVVPYPAIRESVALHGAAAALACAEPVTGTGLVHAMGLLLVQAESFLGSEGSAGTFTLGELAGQACKVGANVFASRLWLAE